MAEPPPERSLDPTQPHTVLIVMPPGPAREEAAGALRDAGFEAQSAGEPYEGTARFVERPADLVLLSLEQFRDRDAAFIETVRRRATTARILLLVPDGARQEAVRALEAGADAYVLLPFYRSELVSVATRLVIVSAATVEPEVSDVPTSPDPPDTPDPLQAPDRADLKILASEVAHAVGNPLQVISLIVEDVVPRKHRRDVAIELERIQAALTIVNRYGELGPPQRERGLIGPVIATQLEVLAAAKVLAVAGATPADGPEFAFDAQQVGQALRDVATVLAAMAPTPPAPIDARLNANRNGVGQLEVWIRARGLTPDPETLDRLRDTVIWTHGETRTPLPGLALAEAVAISHGGRLVIDLTETGASIGIELPLNGA